MEAFIGKYVISLLIILSITSHVRGMASCGNGDFKFESWNGYCYYFSDSSTYITFDDANQSCQNMGANLTSINSEEENEYIYIKMSEDWSVWSFWIGLIKTSQDKPELKDNYFWMDGSTKVYENWAPFEPNDALGVEDCVEFSVSEYYDPKQWNDVPCTGYNKDGFVCKVKALEGWVEYDNSEYYISHKMDDTQLNWYDARQWCMREGGFLVSITSDAETKQISKWAASNGFTGGLWIGAQRLERERTQWRWSDFTTAWSYTNWASGYPDDNNYGHHCAYLPSDDPDGKWKNGHCDQADKGFICKRPANVNPGPKTDPVTPKRTGFCPAGFIDAGNKCLMVKAVSHDQGLTFSDAVNFCRQQDGTQPDLASITSDLEQATINSQLQTITFGLWIGLFSNTALPEDWKWVDNSPRDYDNWAPNEPSSSGQDKCAEVWVVPGPLGTWNDLDCKSKRGYVCQTWKDRDTPIITPPLTTPHTCPLGFIPYWYGCFKYHKDPMVWSDAQDACRKQDPKANLVGIHHEAENSAVQTTLLERGTEIWTGFIDKDKSGEYKWMDDWATFYTNWASGQPRRENDQAGCVKMAPDGTWSDAICSVPLPFICKVSMIGALTTPTPKPGRCPQRDGWEEHSEHCYFFAPHESHTWDMAKQQCQDMGYQSTLASIHSELENRYIYDKLYNKDGGRRSVWIGMHRSKQDNNFRWTDRSSIQYEAWAPGEPNGAERDEHCVEMYNEYWPERWNDHYCDDSKGYVCKAPKSSGVTLPTEPSVCPSGWRHHGTACYLFQPDANVAYNKGRERCQELGGASSELASIHGWSESFFIREHMEWDSDLPVSSNFYIGMAKEKPGEPYLWADGSEVDFEYWARGEPSDGDGNNEFCVEADIKSGRWYGVKCFQMRGMVCKIPTGDGGGLSGGAIAGIVIGVLLAIILTAVIVAAILTQKRVIDNPLGRFSISGMRV